MLKQLLRAPGRMDCARASALIPLHITGDLPARRVAALTHHLRSCAACRAVADEYAASRAWVQAGAQPVFANEFYDDIRAAVLRQLRQERPPAAPQPASFFAPLPGWRLAYVVASVALLCVGGALAWQAHSKYQSQQPMAADTRRARELAPTPSGITAPNDPPRTAATPPPRVARHQRPAVHHQVIAYAPQPRVRQPVQQTPAANAPGAEVARIELQTADPNIRIIWLAQAQPADALSTKDR